MKLISIIAIIFALIAVVLSRKPKAAAKKGGKTAAKRGGKRGGKTAAKRGGKKHAGKAKKNFF